MELVGYKETKFTAQDTGEVIEGINLYLTGPQDYVEGVACERVFLTKKKLDGYVPEIGDEIELVYNRYGKVDKIITAR